MNQSVVRAFASCILVAACADPGTVYQVHQPVDKRATVDCLEGALARIPGLTVGTMYEYPPVEGEAKVELAAALPGSVFDPLNAMFRRTRDSVGTEVLIVEAFWLGGPRPAPDQAQVVRVLQAVLDTTIGVCRLRALSLPRCMFETSGRRRACP